MKRTISKSQRLHGECSVTNVIVGVAFVVKMGVGGARKWLSHKQKSCRADTKLFVNPGDHVGNQSQNRVTKSILWKGVGEPLSGCPIAMPKVRKELKGH